MYCYFLTTMFILCFGIKKGLSENFPDSPLIQLLINDYFIISFFVITELPFLRFT